MSNHEHMERFGEKLHTLRKRQGLSQIQLSDILGVDYSYVGKMERGERSPNVTMIFKIAEIFDVTPNHLMLDDQEID